MDADAKTGNAGEDHHVLGAIGEGGTLAPGSHRGRPVHWIVVVVMIAGFTLSGVALTIGPDWLLFWIGAGVVAVGGIAALATDIFGDVVLDEPRILPERPHTTLRRGADRSSDDRLTHHSSFLELDEPRERYVEDTADVEGTEGIS